MRLTNTMMINNLMNNLGKTSSRINSYSNQIQTGSKYQLPSEAPILAAKSIRYKSSISKTEQYQKNVNDAREVLKVTESALDSYNEILTRIKELSTQAVNVTYSNSDLQEIKSEVSQLKEEAIRIANTEYNGRFIFSGYKTNQKLLNDDGTYNIDVTAKTETVQVPLVPADPLNPDATMDVEKIRETINYDIGFGGKVQVNTLGPDVFGDAEVGESAGIMAAFDRLIEGMSTGDVSAMKAASKEFENYQQIELDALADVGARMNRLDLTENRLESSLTNLEEAKSINDDTNYAEAITKLTNEKSIYEASLAVGAQVVQKSLLDYL